MKYFDKLPKRTYETTLGSFSISDYFSYYKFNFNLVNKREFEFDSKTTLVEAASTLYEDPNSFWLILLANETINPFLLFVDNYTDYIQNNQYKTTTKIRPLGAGSDAKFMNAGSIVVLNSPTSGNPYDFSYVGNFDLNGDIYIVESQNSYTKEITLKPTANGTSFTENANLSDVQYIDSELSQTWELSTTDPYWATEVSSYLNSVESIDDSGPIGTILFKDMTISDRPPVYSPTYNYNQQSYQEAAQYANRKVNIFNPSELSKVTSRLITIKYT